MRDTFPDTPIVMASPIWRSFKDDERYADYVAFGTLLRQSVDDLPGMTILDGLKLVSHREDRFEDGIHPNDIGFAEFVINLYMEIINKGNRLVR